MKRFLFISLLSVYTFAMSSCAKEELESPTEARSEYVGAASGSHSFNESCLFSHSNADGGPAQAPINDDGDDEEEGRGNTSTLE